MANLAPAPPPQSGAGKTVCVTGASGLVGSHIVKQLLPRGYKVEAIVPRAPEHYQWLFELAKGASGTLELVQAEVQAGGALDDVIASSDCVIHTEEVRQFGCTNQLDQIVTPAVEGTRNVFQSILKAPRVKNVVMTSSVEACSDAKAHGAGSKTRTYTEDDWHQELSLKDAFAMAKTKAEKYAWKEYEKRKGAEGAFELVVICPGIVLGTLLDKAQGNDSVKMIVQMMSGEVSMCPNVWWSVAHAHDVALAHVLALEKPDAKGRYIVTNQVSISMHDIASIIKEGIPRAQVPTGILGLPIPNAILAPLSLTNAALTADYTWRKQGHWADYSNKRAKEELGINFISKRKAILSTAQCLVDAGLVPGEKKQGFPWHTDWSVVVADKVEDKLEDGTEKPKSERFEANLSFGSKRSTS